MSAQLKEPIECGKFWKSNRSKRDVVIVSLREFEGRALIDCRVHYTDSDGRLKPSNKGLALVVGRLPDLAVAIAKAHTKARELGLIDDEAAE